MASIEQSSDDLRQAISSKISELEALTRAAGDAAVSEHLKRISESENQLLSLHQALVKKLKRRSKSYTSISERQTWFSNFISHNGERLSNDDACSLAAITKDWALSDTGCLKTCAEVWAKFPHFFCEGVTPDTDVIRRCYNDLERMEELDASRRKALLVTLSRQVQERQKGFLSNPKSRKRSRKKADDRESRSSIFLTSALGNICSQLWDDSEKDQNTRRKKLSRYSLYGWKWDRLANGGLILSLTQVAAKRFEYHKWTPIKIEALNAYTETLPQFAIQGTLHKAWVAILNYYAGNTTLRQRASSQEFEESQVSIEPSIQTPTSSDDSTGTSLGLGITSLDDVPASADLSTGPSSIQQTLTSSDDSMNTSLGLDLTSLDDVAASADRWLYLSGGPSSIQQTLTPSDDSTNTSLGLDPNSLDDVLASADRWLFLHSADGNATSHILASASSGSQNIGSTHIDAHIGYPSAVSGSRTSNNLTYMTHMQPVAAAASEV